MTFKFSLDTFKGYSVTEPIENIFVIEEFISEDEQKSIFELAESSSQEDWEVLYFSNLKPFCMKKFGRDDVENLVAEGKFEITPGWKDKNLSLSIDNKTNTISNNIEKKIFSFLTKDSKLMPAGPTFIQRQQPGVPLTAHFDQYTDPAIQYAAIIYINDNYIDGELFFPKKDFQIKPKSRTLVIFPGTEEFTHGVNPPGEGPFRYVLPGFITIKDFYDEEKIKQFNSNNYSKEKLKNYN